MKLFTDTDLQQQPEEIKKKIEKLKTKILYYQKEYYENNTSKISDTEFDALFHELKHLELQYPKFITPDSPTQKIYNTTQTKLTKTKHLVPMISLENAFHEKDLSDWEERFIKILEKSHINFYKDPQEIKYIVEPKFDGLGISCVYKNGKFIRAVTRGNGEEGENVSLNMQTLEDHKNTIPSITPHTNSLFEIRGEIVMKKSIFKELNTKLSAENKKQFSTPRNAASGSLRQLDATITKQRKLSVFFYETPLKETQNYFTTYDKTLSFFEKHHIPYCKHYYTCQTLSEVLRAIKKIEKLRENFDFDIDGAVIKINNYHLREIIGSTGHHPRWAIAWKFPAIQVQTQLQHIEWQVGRTGVLTPVAHLQEVVIDGVKVNRATLHNMDYIKEKKLNIHDTVLLERSGDVIPKIIKSITAEQKEQYQSPHTVFSHIPLPTTCPICNAPTYKKQDEVALRCSNTNCPQILKGKLEHFVSKKCLNIKGFGTEICDDIIEKKLITQFSDFSHIYTFSSTDWAKIKNFKQKSIENIQSALKNSTTQPFWRIIHALGITGVGEKTSKILAQHYPHFRAFTHISQTSLETLQNIHDIGEKTAQEIITFIQNTEHQKLFEQLEIIFQTNTRTNTALSSSSKKTPFLHKKFVITGSFPHHSRDDLKTIIEEHGGTCVGSVSKKTDYVVVGDKAGQKKTHAESIGIPLLTLSEFFTLLNHTNT